MAQMFNVGQKPIHQNPTKIILFTLPDERDMIEIVTAAQKHSELEIEYSLHAFH